MTSSITAFERSPDRGSGLARDMRLRSALEEVAQTYGVRLRWLSAMKESAHRMLHPFRQIPILKRDDLALLATTQLAGAITRNTPWYLRKWKTGS